MKKTEYGDRSRTEYAEHGRMRRTAGKKADRLRKTALFLFVGAVLALPGCGKRGGEGGGDETVSQKGAEEPFAAGLIPAESAEQEASPVDLTRGGYSWEYLLPSGEMQSEIADAMSPLDENFIMQELPLPEGEREAEYRLVIDMLPDRAEVTAWAVSDIGNMDAPAVETAVYEIGSAADAAAADSYVFPMQEGRVYVIHMVWDADRRSERGFSGEGDYVVRTSGGVLALSETGGTDASETDMTNASGTDVTNAPETDVTDASETDVTNAPEAGGTDASETDGADAPETDVTNAPEADGSDAAGEGDADRWGLSMTVQDVTLTGLTIVFSQSGGEPSGELMTGCAYVLEKWDGTAWTPLPYITEEDVAWHDLAYNLPMDAATELTVDWEWLYGRLSPGRYRIGKSVMDFRGTANYDTGMYYAEFEPAPLVCF